MSHIKLYEEYFHSLNESTGLDAGFFLASDNNWYMYIEEWNDYGTGGSGGYANYGPFISYEQAEQYLEDNFANPGGYSVDQSGRMKPPTDAIRPSYSRRWR